MEKRKIEAGIGLDLRRMAEEEERVQRRIYVSRVNGARRREREATDQCMYSSWCQLWEGAKRPAE